MPTASVVPDDASSDRTVRQNRTGESIDEAEPELRALLEAVRRHATGLDLDLVAGRSGGMEGVVSRMFASVPGANHYDAKIGPFYDTAGLRAWRKVTRQSIDGQIERRDLLCVRTADGHRLYPAFQFEGPGGALLPQLRTVLAALDPRSIDEWGDALWLNSPMPYLDGATPAQALRQGRIEEVLVHARSAGALWTS